MVQRKFYQDEWNKKKVWEVVRLSGGFYLRQYICGRQQGRGVRTSKKFIEGIGIMGFQECPMPALLTGYGRKGNTAGGQ